MSYRGVEQRMPYRGVGSGTADAVSVLGSGTADAVSVSGSGEWGVISFQLKLKTHSSKLPKRQDVNHTPSCPMSYV